MEMTKREYRNWVNRLARTAIESKTCGIIELFNNKGIVIVNCKTGETGVSKCHPDDTFDLYTGIALAYARLKKMEIPTIKGGIKNEIEDFILDNIAPTCCLLIEDRHGISKYVNNVDGREKLVTRIVKDIADFADGNVDKDCKTTRGLWEYCRKRKDLGSICTLYYLDIDGNYVSIA